MMVRAVLDLRLSKAAAARQSNAMPKTVAKWVERFRAEASMDYRIARHGLFHCQAKQRLPHARRSRLCGAGATLPSRSPRIQTAPRE
jgi:hypothetical protein